MKVLLSKRLLLMPGRLSWWVWTITALCLAAGLIGYYPGFYAAIVISVIQTIVYGLKERSARTFPVQIRLAYTGLLISCQVPSLGWLYWVPATGTFALVLFGYCLMARILSLFPGNRTEPTSLDLIRRTFLAPPVPGNVQQGLPAGGCAGGTCVLEGKIATLSAHRRG
ncbi:MAG TPA: hypothetical protein VIS96_00855 [Terrimicrobiaceae bacterium]